MLIFVSDFLSVTNVGKKMAAKNLLKGRGFMATFRIYMCENFVTQGKNIYAVD